MRSAGSGKSRKPYKITKPRERWSEDEHEKFLEAIKRFGRNWKEIVSFVGTRSVSQVRSHAQKHFIRLEKKGLGAVVPPARRKARWGDKHASDVLDGNADSDQELSASHRQTGSSSSMSTVDFHPPVTSAAHCVEGSGYTDFADCQPLNCQQQRFNSFSSRSTSFTSPSTQPMDTIISCAQEFLQCCNSSGGSQASVEEQQACAPEQGTAVKPRAAMLDMLQQIVKQQPSNSRLPDMPANVQSSASVARQQQQQLQQLLYQPQSTGTYTSMSRHQNANARPAFGTWPWQRAAPTNFPSQFSAARHAQAPCTFSDSQLCPQLDGSFLAEVIKTSDNLPNAAGHGQPLTSAKPFLPAVPHQSMGVALSMALTPGLAPPVVSPTTSFQSLPSAKSAITVQPEVELPASLCTPGADLDSPVGLDEEEFWADFDLVDPLTQAVDAFMGGDGSDDSCLQSVYPNTSPNKLC